MITSTVNRNNYPGAGSTGPFTYSFRVHAYADLLVTRRSSDGVETTLTYGVDFTATGVSNPSGTITLTVALAVGETLSIRRAPALEQPVSLANQAAYFAATHEAEFDRLVMQIQSLQDQLDHTVRVRESWDPATLSLELKPETGKALVWQSSTQLGNSNLDSSAVALPGAGRTTSTLSTYLANNAVFNILDFVAPGYVAGTTDILAAFDLAMDAVVAAGRGSIFFPAGDYIVNTDFLDVLEGVALFGAGGATGEYDGGAPKRQTRLIKQNAGVAGPIVVLHRSSRISNMELRHEKSGGATTGILRMGTDASEDVTYAHVDRVWIRGVRTGTLTYSGSPPVFASACVGVFFTRPNTGPNKARFFNHFSNVTVSECDVGIHLKRLANGNAFTNITTRECHVHWDLAGESTAAADRVIENMFSNIGMFAITVLAPAIGIRLRHATNNVFVPFSYEAFGAFSDISDDLTCSSNKFLGNKNESTASRIPNDCIDYGFAIPINRANKSSMLLVSGSSASRDSTGRGNRTRNWVPITGTLPQINNAAGTIVAADADNRRIITFASRLSKSGCISFFGRLRVQAYSPSNRGMHMLDVEFCYRNTNVSTTAGQLCVTRVVNKGNGSPEVTGLYFIKGITGTPRPFAVVLVGGNNAAIEFDAITVSLEIESVENATGTFAMDQHADFSFATAAVTADDVTDAISMLAVADTVV